MKRVNSFLSSVCVLSLSLTLGTTGCDKPASDKVPEFATSPVPQTQSTDQTQSTVQTKAKALSISEWIKGATAESAVDVTDGKNIYVVEFWATWCGPCKTSIPHLSDLQKKYREQGVIFIGVSNETAEKVKPFVEEMGEKMDYIVALDKENTTYRDYMRAYGQNGIPCAFIVNKEGSVAWVGHPFEIEEPLKGIVEGQYDIKAFQQASAPRARVAEYRKRVDQKDPLAGDLGRAVLEEIGTDVDLINQMVDASYAAGDLELLDKVLERMASIDENSAKIAAQIREGLEKINQKE